MAKFEISFTHTEESDYVAIIEAETQEEALQIFNEEPFDHLKDEEPSDVQGTEIVINNTERVG